MKQGLYLIVLQGLSCSKYISGFVFMKVTRFSFITQPSEMQKVTANSL